MMRLLFAIILAALLAGCASTKPEVVIRTVTVEIPVPVPCAAQPVPRPAWAVDALPIGAGPQRQMQALRAERQQRIGYEVKLEAELQNCTARNNVN